MYTKKILLAASGMFLCVATSQAAGLITTDDTLRNDLAWLSDRGVINVSLSTWPLSQEEIDAVLSQAKPVTATERNVISRVEQRINNLKSNVRITGYASSDKPGLPQGFGGTHASDHALSIGAGASDEFWDVNLKGTVEGNQRIEDQSRWNMDGSYGAIKIFNQWLSFGKISQWWGPGYDGSLIRSDAARPVTGFMLQRADQSPFETPWLSWIGRWQYQLSAGQLEQYYTVPEAKLIGGRLTLMPTNFIELGASRIMMWGGEGRPQSWGSFWDGVAGKDNTGTQNEPGNQLASFDFKLKLQPLTGLPVSLYGQLVGEDEAGMLPSQNTYLLGLEGHPEWGTSTINWYIEGATTRADDSRLNYVYAHHIYKGGYYQQGYPLGHAMGGDGRMLSGKVELALDDGQRWSTRITYARVNPNDQNINQAFPRSDTLKGIELGWGYDFQSKVKFDTRVWYTDSDNSTSDDVGAGVGVEIPINL
ncbi:MULTISPECIES: capsule assembly Wzi family protein [unclassified Brenneria]|uniref:capsule assembly Wzi family protein n=1 Tax=unclassified Brenneria TaxID=2634434 RepID=UPI0029C2264B|nr:MULTISPECIES: capsule assembly Wzi family protein [unclassified Brenneria]MDX5630299.1 capsule assembly Wzi family protein [Brenneria sp. L3-3Z]MDX5697444.1 capsule assembly Wzi family protein [Brenneria sp. L4-2C]